MVLGSCDSRVPRLRVGMEAPIPELGLPWEGALGPRGLGLWVRAPTSPARQWRGLSIALLLESSQARCFGRGVWGQRA